MTYREPMLTPGTDHPSAVVLDLLTDAQWRRLAIWSMALGQDVKAVLAAFRPMAEQCGEGSHEIRLIGTLPTCQLFGSLEPDGSTHT